MAQPVNNVLRFKKFAGEGELTMDLFDLTTEPIPALKNEEVLQKLKHKLIVLLRCLYLSCDPSHRIYASGQDSYWPASKKGDKVPAMMIGEVIESKVEAFPKGSCAFAFGNWETYSVLPAAAMIMRIDPSTNIPLETYMAVMNHGIGLTAWAGVHRVLQAKQGDILCVSGAAGAVGSLVCQLGKEAGAKVIGICGTPTKCDFLRKIGCAETINYKTENVKERLHELCPEGVTCYFDNVGGNMTEMVMENMAQNGRVAVCGMISQYDHMGSEGGQIRCWHTILFRRLSVKGLICLDYMADSKTCFADLERLLKANVLHFNKHVFAGDLTKCVEAVQAITRGTNVGKAMVKLGEPSDAAFKCA